MSNDLQMMFRVELIDMVRSLGFSEFVEGQSMQLQAWISMESMDDGCILMLREGEVLYCAPEGYTLNMVINGSSRSALVTGLGVMPVYTPCEHRPFRNHDVDELIWDVLDMGVDAENLFQEFVKLYDIKKIEQTAVNTSIRAC